MDQKLARESRRYANGFIFIRVIRVIRGPKICAACEHFSGGRVLRLSCFRVDQFEDFVSHESHAGLALCSFDRRWTGGVFLPDLHLDDRFLASDCPSLSGWPAGRRADLSRCQRAIRRAGVVWRQVWEAQRAAASSYLGKTRHGHFLVISVSAAVSAGFHPLERDPYIARKSG